jgi:hypothetical protein
MSGWWGSVSNICVRHKKTPYKIFIGKHEIKGPFGRPRLRCRIRDLIHRNMVGCNGMDSYGSGYESLVDSCEHGNELQGFIKFCKYHGS